MRHGKKARKFSVLRKVRVALIKSLIRSLIMHERIRTTLPKAKSIRPLVERLVTRAKKDTVANRREVAKTVEKAALAKLFKEIAPRYVKRAGGYLRITKADTRKDDAQMAIVEFV